MAGAANAGGRRGSSVGGSAGGLVCRRTHSRRRSTASPCKLLEHEPFQLVNGQLGRSPCLQTEAQVRAETTRRIKKLGRDGKPREAVAELANMAKLGIQVGASGLCGRNACRTGGMPPLEAEGLTGGGRSARERILGVPAPPLHAFPGPAARHAGRHGAAGCVRTQRQDGDGPQVGWGPRCPGEPCTAAACVRSQCPASHPPGCSAAAPPF